MQRTTRFHLCKTLTHFSVFVLVAAPVSGSLWPEIHPFSQGWGAKLGGTGHFGAVFCGLLGENGPDAGQTLGYSTPLHPLGEGYGRVGIGLPARPCSQLGANLVPSFMGDKARIDLFVQVQPVQQLSWAQECLQGVVSDPGPPTSLFSIWVCAKQRVDSKLGGVGKPLGQEISK